MRKTILLTMAAAFIMFYATAVVLPEETTAEADLSNITKGIPSNWWDGGWDKSEELQVFIITHPGDTALCAKAQYYIGCYYHSRQKYPEAIEEYNAVLNQYPSVASECAKAHFEIGQITLYSLNKPEEAITYYRKVIENYPYDSLAPICQLCIGRAYLKLGNGSQAKIELQRVIDNYPSATTQQNEARADLKGIDGNNGSERTVGVLTFPEGRYEGEIRFGKMNGKGVLIYSSGTRHEGEFQDNNFNGKGIHTWADGDVYEGDYVLNKKEGYGILRYNTGDVYEGQFKYDLYHGQGTLILMSLDGKKHSKSGLWYLGQYLGKEEKSSATLIPTKEEDLSDEKQIARIINGKSVGVDEIFKFADKLLDEGFVNKAMALYEAGLVLESARLDYQLKLAQLEVKNGRPEEAAARARAIYEYAENDDMINEAKNILVEAGSSEASDLNADPPLDATAEIILVPVGKVNGNAMVEAAKVMQKKLGIVVKVEQEVMGLPADKSREYQSVILNSIMKETLDQMPEEEKKKFISAWGGSKEDLDKPEGQKQFLEFVMKQSGAGPDNIDSFRKLFASHPQYEADAIIENLRKKYDVKTGSKIKGCIGITPADIYDEDHKSISFTSEKKYAVVSYFNYAGEPNYDPQNRSLLVKRMSKAGISAALNMINIPYCSTPYCANSYSGDVQRRDALSMDLCEKCKKEVSDYKNRMKQAELTP